MTLNKRQQHERWILPAWSPDWTSFAELKGREKVRLVAQSENNFSGFYGLGIQFVTDAKGAVTHLLERRVSRDYRFRRTK
jgi:hypothetical protein